MMCEAMDIERYGLAGPVHHPSAPIGIDALTMPPQSVKGPA
jgi:hypothetical protein